MESDPVKVFDEEDPFAEAPAVEPEREVFSRGIILPEPVGAPVVEEPRRMPSDDELQEELSKIALGIKLRMRSTVGDVSDSFVVGGDYAPGRQRWVQTRAYDSAVKQAAEMAAALA